MRSVRRFRAIKVHRLIENLVPAALFLVTATAVGSVGSTSGFAQSAGASGDAVARVGEYTVSGEEYLGYLHGYLRSRLYHQVSPDRVRELADEALESLITERLLLRAAEQRGFAGDPNRAAQEVKDLRDRYSGTESWASVEPQLATIQRQVLERSKIEQLKEQISAVAEPSEADLREFYRANPDLFTQPPSWDLNYILLGVLPSATAEEWADAKQLGEQLAANLAGGASFEDLARQHSTDESASSGGALGRVHEGQVASEAAELIEKLKPGEISRPVRLLEGYAIFRLNKRHDAQLQPFENVLHRIDTLYRRERAEDQLSDFLDEQRAGTQIKTFDVSSYIENMLANQ